MYIYIHTYICNLYTYYICIYIYNIHMYTHITYIYIYNTHIYIYNTYTYTYIHTNIHTYIPSSNPASSGRAFVLTFPKESTQHNASGISAILSCICGGQKKSRKKKSQLTPAASPLSYPVSVGKKKSLSSRGLQGAWPRREDV